MFEEFHAQIRAEAVEAYPNEAVWLITHAGCRRVDNVADDPKTTFRVSKDEMRKAHAEGLLAVVHSHPDGPDYPTEADMRGQMATGVPWGIVSTNDSDSLPLIWWGDGVPRPPLEDRTFRHGITDCYSAIRDYYALEHNIELPEFPRSWEWWKHGQDLYTDGFPKAGFRRFDPDVEPPRAGDMWFAQLHSKVPSHGGIYLGNDLILHHITPRSGVSPTSLCRQEPIARWLPHITHWLRHKELDT